jgi:hypothetical protein
VSPFIHEGASPPVIVDFRLRRASDFETYLGDGRWKIREGSPRHCPLGLVDEPHEGHEFYYAYLDGDGRTVFGHYWCAG